MSKERQGAPGQPRGRQGELSALFTRAVAQHQAGQLLDAETLYRQVLMVEPQHFGSLHHLGILALQQQRPDAAVDPITRAIAVNDRVPEPHYNLGFALQSIGRLPEAVDRYRRAIALKPDYVEAHTNLGNVLMQVGSRADAATSYARVVELKPTAGAHYNLGNALAQLGRLEEAVREYGSAIALDPALAGAHNNLANALAALGRPEEALPHFERALGLAPDLVEPHVNLGTTLLGMGRLGAAKERFERALSIKPDFAEAHSNLGSALMAEGSLEEAEQHLRQALAARPDLGEAHNNLGIVLGARGDLAAASREFERALACRGDFIDAYNNLARAFLGLGQLDNALGALRRALGIRETIETKLLFVQCVKDLAVPPPLDDFRALMTRALEEPWGRANDLAKVASRLVKQDAVIAGAIKIAMAALPHNPVPEQFLDRSALAAVAGNRLLRALLTSTVISDVELERFLTVLRGILLQEVSEAVPPPDGSAVELSCALSQQCFLNERVFAESDEERAAAQRLREEVSAALGRGEAIAELKLAVTGMYFPLHTLPRADALMSREWPLAVEAMLSQQVREPMEEQALRATIPALTAIEQATSQQVRRQYEENPYPRWTKAAPAPRPLPLDQYLRRRLPLARFLPLGKTEIDILIAGCGTGQHAIETAQRFAGANMLAVDLSLASLAYATRKTLSLAPIRIEYAQADLLALGSIGKSFDLIEVSGVLHHLADPLEGWRVLLSLLRPGGVMAVGLYSETARAGIVRARELIAGRGYPPTAEGIRACRRELIALNAEGRFGDVIAADDFFSTSGCRDLLFHVQERCLTIAQIADFIAENGLNFLGFDLDPITAQRYLTRFPADTALTDFANWATFELENPATFAGMYQFWVQKP